MPVWSAECSAACPGRSGLAASAGASTLAGWGSSRRWRTSSGAERRAARDVACLVITARCLVVRQVRAPSGQVCPAVEQRPGHAGDVGSGHSCHHHRYDRRAPGGPVRRLCWAFPLPAILPSSGLASAKRARPAGITISGPTRRSGLSTGIRARRLLLARYKEKSGWQSGSEPARSMAAMKHMRGGSRTGRSISCCSACKLRQPATPDKKTCQHAAAHPLWRTWSVCVQGPAGQLTTYV